MLKEYLLKNEKVALTSFSRAIENRRVSHAYILIGEEGTPLYETAIFMAKSILCDSGSLADETCLTCRRIDNGNYPDLVILDGSKDSLKKEEVIDLVSNFRKAPLERKGIMVYVIHLLENMSVEAENSLLKFLEEPSENCYAILTTANVTKILPTILSRAENLRIYLPPFEEVYENALAQGVEKEDAYLLSHLLGEADAIKEMAEDDDYIKAKKALHLFIEASKDEETFYPSLFALKIDPLLKGKGAALLFLSLLENYLRCLAYLNVGKSVDDLGYHIYDGLEGKLDALKAMRGLGEIRKAIEGNVAPALALDELAYSINR